MTALCAGGASGPKPGVNEVIIFSSSQLGSFLNNKGGLWATLAIGALGVLTYEATALCSTDPPAQPTITADDYKALLALGPPAEFATALAKLRDLVTIALWFELCQCTSVATPQPSTGLLNPPAGITVPDYALTSCAQGRARLNIRPEVGVFDDATNITRNVFPNLQYTTSSFVDATHPSQEIAEIPSTWQSIHGTNQLVSGTTNPTQGYGVFFSVYNASKNPLGNLMALGVTNSQPFIREPATGETPITSAQRYFAINAFPGLAASTAGVTDWTLTVNCAPGSASTPGCCADPVTLSLLNGLVQELALVRSDVRLLQRYGLPFAYTSGAQHVGLSGSGAAPLERSVGLQIQVTAFPPGNQQMLGQPPYIFDLGWISVLTPDGLLDEIRLTRQTTTWMSKLIPSSTRIGWGLRDGVVVSITELRAEA